MDIRTWYLHKKALWKRLALCLLILLLLAGMYFIGAKQMPQTYMAAALVESFGWEIDETKEIRQDAIGKQSFYRQYFSLLGKDPYRVPPEEPAGAGNITGISPKFFREGYFGLDDAEKEIIRIRVPLRYAMPEGMTLEAWVSFYQDTLCETSLHAVERSTDPAEENGFQSYGTICPLNGSTADVEDWKSRHGLN